MSGEALANFTSKESADERASGPAATAEIASPLRGDKRGDLRSHPREGGGEASKAAVTGLAWPPDKSEHVMEPE